MKHEIREDFQNLSQERSLCGARLWSTEHVNALLELRENTILNQCRLQVWIFRERNGFENQAEISRGNFSSTIGIDREAQVEETEEVRDDFSRA